MRSNQPVERILLGIFLVLALALASCGPTTEVETAPTNPRAWFGGPPDGSEVPPDEVSAMCHGFAQGGVAQIELWVNGALANQAANPTPGGEYFTAVLTFQPSGPGSYVLLCRAYDQAGEMAQSGPSTVVVSGEVPTAMPTETGVPTPTPTATEAQPTATSVPPTATPVAPTATTIPPTATPVPPTATPRPPTSTPTTPPAPTIQSLVANPPTINKGSCSRISWAVVGVISAVYFDGEGVGDHDFRDKCPNQTTTYILRAVGPGGERTANITVEVAQDTTGPTITNVDPLAGGRVYTGACSGGPTYPTSLEISATVTDSSGVRAVEFYCTLPGQGEQYCGAFVRGGGNNWRISYDPAETFEGTVSYRIKATDDSPARNVSWSNTGYIQVYDVPC